MEANTEEWSFITVIRENCVKVGQDRKTQINEDAPLQGEGSLSLGNVGRYTIPTSIIEVPNPCQLAKHLCLLWTQWRWERENTRFMSTRFSMTRAASTTAHQHVGQQTCLLSFHKYLTSASWMLCWINAPQATPEAAILGSPRKPSERWNPDFWPFWNSGPFLALETLLGF